MNTTASAAARVAPRIALIHATALAIEPIEQAFGRLWPEAERMNLLEDSLPRDKSRLAAEAPDLTRRFVALSEYARLAGAVGVLYTCSAFGPEIEAAREAVRLPTFKPNEAMFTDALAIGARVGWVATFEPAMAPLRAELLAMARAGQRSVDLSMCFVPGAFDALNHGDAERHDALIAEAACAMTGVDVLVLAQFSMARARPGRGPGSGPGTGQPGQRGAGIAQRRRGQAGATG